MLFKIVLVQIFFLYVNSVFVKGDLPIFPNETEKHSESMNPAFIGYKIEIPLPDIKFSITNITVNDLPTCSLKKSQYTNGELTFDYNCDALIAGYYYMESKNKPDEHVENKFYVFFKNVAFDMKYFVGEKKKDDGKNYFELRDPKYNFNISYEKKEQQISFADMNEYIGEELTEYSKKHDIILTVSKPIMDEVFKKVASNLQSYFEVNPVNDIHI